MLNLYVKLSMLRALASERVRKEEDGAAAIEYALIAGLIAIAIVAGAIVLGDAISDIFDRIGVYLDGLTIT